MSGIGIEINQIIEKQKGIAPKIDKGTQILLTLKYKELVQKKEKLPDFDDIEFKLFSQNGEDGILHFIFSLINPTNKIFVEIGAGDGIENNTANLIINHGWTGLHFDGDRNNVSEGIRFYSNNPEIRNYPPKSIHAWITTENVNKLITENGVNGEIDLLSIDIDGVDYWIWKEIECIRPRVVIVETQCIWGPEISVTVPYSPDFRPQFYDGFGIYSGASLNAFVKLAREKGYRLVGVQRYGYNAFFIRNDIGMDVFPEIETKACFNHPFTKWAMETLLPKVRDLVWEEV